MRAIYPGSFDPVTYGHLDIITRASKISGKLIVAVLDNMSKHQVFSVEERVEMLKELTKDTPNVKIMSFRGLLVDFAKINKAKMIIRGLRAVTDFEYEFQMALTNRQLDEDIDTYFIPASLQHLYLSSSIAKEVFLLGGNIDSMVPPGGQKNADKKIY